MNLLLATLIGLGLACSGFLYLELRRQQAMISQTHSILHSLDGTGEPSPGPEQATLSYEVVIRLNDPLAVAAREAPHSKLVSGIAPNLVRKEVYRQVVQESEALLAKREIEGVVTRRLRLETNPC